MQKLKDKLATLSSDELYALVYTDSLTGLSNRRAFEEDERAHVAVVDLDSLKYVNDTYGHRWGDHMLVNLACTLALQFGHENVYRLSGDEFVIKSASDFNDDDFNAALRAFPMFSWGVGTNIVDADAQLGALKDIREGLGLRAKRGERPCWAGMFEEKWGVAA